MFKAVKHSTFTAITSILLVVCVALVLIAAVYFAMSVLNPPQHDLVAVREDREKSNWAFSVILIAATAFGIVAVGKWASLRDTTNVEKILAGSSSVNYFCQKSLLGSMNCENFITEKEDNFDIVNEYTRANNLDLLFICLYRGRLFGLFEKIQKGTWDEAGIQRIPYCTNPDKSQEFKRIFGVDVPEW